MRATFVISFDISTLALDEIFYGNPFLSSFCDNGTKWMPPKIILSTSSFCGHFLFLVCQLDNIGQSLHRIEKVRSARNHINFYLLSVSMLDLYLLQCIVLVRVIWRIATEFSKTDIGNGNLKLVFNISCCIKSQNWRIFTTPIGQFYIAWIDVESVIFNQKALSRLITCKYIFRRHHTAWKESKCGVFPGLYFPVFGLNMEIYWVNLSIQSEQIQGNIDQKKVRIWTLFTQCHVIIVRN